MPVSREAAPGTNQVKLPGDQSGEVTPVSIPNTEVKLPSADGTARVTVWESRTSPGFFIPKVFLRLSLQGLDGFRVLLLWHSPLPDHKPRRGFRTASPVSFSEFGAASNQLRLRRGLSPRLQVDLPTPSSFAPDHSALAGSSRSAPRCQSSAPGAALCPPRWTSARV